jgi:hypothetical protein
VRGARFKGMSAGADDVNFVVCGVNTYLHDVKGSPFPRNLVYQMKTPVIRNRTTGVR